VAPIADAEALFAAHQPGLLRYLSRAIGHREAARDLTQDVFVRIAGSDILPASDDERRAWIFRIARNLAIDHQRRQSIRHDEAAPPRAEDAVQAQQDTSLAVNGALAALDPLDRDVFLMREVAGLSYAEIAAACDLTVAAVRSRLHRARLDLRDRLQAPIGNARQAPLRARLPEKF
jgi:RNA polymerase sigma-70 factor, ECF subfamily